MFFTGLNFFLNLSVNGILIYNNQRTNDYHSDFLITAKLLNRWKVQVLIITLLVLL